MANGPGYARSVLLAVLLLGVVFVAIEPGTTAQEQQHSAWGTPVDEETLLPTGPQGRHFRIEVEVEAPGMEGVRDLPVQTVLDLAEILPAHAGYPTGAGEPLAGFRLELDSFLVQEVDADGQRLGDWLPVIAEPGSVEGDGSFDPVHEPVVTVRWVMPGETTDTRYFHVYFDSSHNNPGPGPEFTAREQMPLAASIGPGRGTTLFVPLTPTGIGNMDRRVHVTALHDDTEVAFYEYTRQGLPRSAPARDVSLQAGQTIEYLLGDGGDASTEGTVMVTADRPVLAEALFVQNRGGFVSNDFIPSADGGFLGSTFIARPATGETWHFFCPATAATNMNCQFQIGGSTNTIGANGTLSRTMTGGQPVTVTTTDGSQMLVQRAGQGLTYWPAADGPRSASHFMGHATSGERFGMIVHADNTCVVAQTIDGPWLSRSRGAGWCGQAALPAGAFHPSTPWGGRMTSWPDSDHAGGALRMDVRTGNGIDFMSGPLDSATDSSLVVPQSSDGGRTYHVFVPSNNDGDPVGRIVVFALHDATRVQEAKSHGGSSQEVPTLRSGQRHDLHVDEGGWWTLRADRPIVVAWLNHRIHDYGAYVPGFTDAAEVTVTNADYAGYALEVTVEGSNVIQRQPGDRASFTVRVTNHAQDVTGNALPDTAHVALRGLSSDWPEPDFDLRSRALGPGGSGTFNVSLVIPEGAVEAGGSESFRFQATSGGNGELVVDHRLRINFIIRYGVEVAEAAGNVERNIDHNETAQYEVQVINRGSAPDSFDVQFTCPPDDWEQVITPAFEVFDGEGEPIDPGDLVDPCETGLRTPVIEPREHETVFIDMQAGEAVSLASRAVTRVSATSDNDRSVTDSLRLSTVVGVERSFRVLVDEPTRTITPGGETTFTMRIENDAEVNEELNVTIHSALPDGWDDPVVRWVDADASLQAVNNTIRINPNGNATLTLTRSVPEDAPALSLGLDRVRMESQFDRDAPATDTALRVLAATKRGVEATVNGPTHAVDPGSETRFDLQVASTGNVNQTITVRPVLPDGDWSATDEDGASPPWRIEVPPFATTRLPVLVSPDPTTPPGVDAAHVDFELTGTGFSVLKTGFSFEVEERRAVAVQGATVRLDPGRLIEAPTEVRNTGNVPLDIAADWDALPDWEVSTGTLTLQPGASGTLETWMRVPVDVTSDDDFDATLRIMQGANVLATTQWSFSVNAPQLEAVIDRIHPLNDDQASYRVLVTNTGGDSAHNVTVLLDREGEGTLDRFLIQQIRPGATATANLLGPIDPSGVTVRVIADHDPTGIRVSPPDQELEERGLPAPGIIAVLVVIALLARLGAIPRRRWDL